VALSGTVFIDRANRKSAIAAFDSAIEEIKGNKQSVWIFPVCPSLPLYNYLLTPVQEGTRSYFNKPDLLPFKKGAFHLAVQAGVPIVPVVVANYSHVLHLQNRTFEPGVINVKVGFFSPAFIHLGFRSWQAVKVMEPIPTKGLKTEDVDGLVLRTRETMLAELQRISTTGVKAQKTQ
jgi:lysophosphatidate acyltransferase